MHSIVSRASRARWILGLLLVALCGCSEEDSDEESDALPSDIVGSWSLECTNLSGPDTDNNYKSIAVAAIFQANGNYSMAIGNFIGDSPGSCLIGLETISENGTATGGSTVTEPEGAKTLTQTPSKVEITPATDTDADQKNTDSYCGASDWVGKVAKDVTLLTCVDDADEDVDQDAVNYDIYLVTDETSLAFGETDETNDGSSADRRPITMGTSIVLTKE